MEETVKKENDFLSQKVYDKFAYPIVKWLAKTSITPNQVTFFGLLIDFVAAYLFFLGNYLYFQDIRFVLCYNFLLREFYKTFEDWIQ